MLVRLTVCVKVSAGESEPAELVCAWLPGGGEDRPPGDAAEVGGGDEPKYPVPRPETGVAGVVGVALPSADVAGAFAALVAGESYDPCGAEALGPFTLCKCQQVTR